MSWRSTARRILAYPALVAERWAAEEETRIAEAEHLKDIYERDSRYIRTEPEKGYRVAGSKSDDTLIVDDMEHEAVLETSLDLWLTDPTYRGAVDTLKRFVWGGGPDVSAKLPEVEPDEKTGKKKIPPATLAAAQESNAYWAAFCKANKMVLRGKEMATREYRDGGVFLCWKAGEAPPPKLDDEVTAPTVDDAPRSEWASKSVEMELPNGERKTVLVPYFKFLPARRIKDARGVVTKGIQLDANDEPETYYLAPPRGSGGTESTPIEAKYVMHWKYGADSDWKRGYPWLMQSFRNIVKYNRVLDANLNRFELQACIVLHEKYASNVAAAAARSANPKTANADEDPNKQKRLKPGSVYYSGPGVDIDFRSPQMDGCRAEDVRLWDLQTVRNSSMAEPTITGDAANNNRASMDAAKDPEVRLYEDERETWGCHLSEELWTFVIWFGKEFAGLSSNAIEDAETEWPPLVTRNQKEEAEALSIDRANGLSKVTYLKKRGYDPEEQANLSKLEAQEDYDNDPEIKAESEEFAARDALKAEAELAKAADKGKRIAK